MRGASSVPCWSIRQGKSRHDGCDKTFKSYVGRTHNEAFRRDQGRRHVGYGSLLISCTDTVVGSTAGSMCGQTVLRNNTWKGELACFGEVVWPRVAGTRLLRGKFEVNWLELVWLGKRENSDEHLCVAMSNACASVPHHQRAA